MSLSLRTLLKLFVTISFAYAPARADIRSESIEDRASVERIYHHHRTGTKPPFEQAMPRETLERLVREDRQKEAALSKMYAVAVTAEMVEAEVQRIESTTRAPEVLVEIKRALGDDPARFARCVARPIVVERILRERFENDDALHAGQRAQAEKARQLLLAHQAVGGMQESTWQLGSRPAETASPAPVAAPSPSVPSTSGTYSHDATVQVTQPSDERQEKAGDRKLYFEDLDPQLQKVLRVQLRKPGDASAVIETPAAFLVFSAKEISATAITASCLSVPKRSYEEWLTSIEP